MTKFKIKNKSNTKTKCKKNKSKKKIITGGTQNIYLQKLIRRIVSGARDIKTNQGNTFKEAEKRRDSFYKRTLPLLKELVDPNIVNNKDLTYIKNLNETVWGIKPGTQLFHNNAAADVYLSGYAQHHAVYLGFGLIVEVGAPTANCNIEIGSNLSAKRSCLGIDFLDYLIVRGNGDIFRVIYPKEVLDLDDPIQIRLVLQRCIDGIEKLEEWPYNIFTNNCQHWAQIAMTGQENVGFSGMHQVECMLNLSDKVEERVPIEEYQSESCKDIKTGNPLPCSVVNKTDKGYCKGDVYRSLKNPLNKWCYIDSCSNNDPNCWDYVNKIEQLYLCKSPRKLRNGKEKYHVCVPTEYGLGSKKLKK